MIQRKGGRKPSPVKRVKQVGVKFLRTEYFLLQAKARASNYKLAVMIREMAINKEIKVVTISEEDRKTIISLIQLGNNINQLARLSHQEGIMTVHNQLEDALSSINQILNKVQKP